MSRSGGLSGEESPYTATVLTNHAAALRATAQRTGQRAPLDEAIGALRRALRATAPDSPERAGRLSEFGHNLADRGQSGDAAEAVRAYRESCRLADPDNVPVRLVAGRAWGAWATRREAHEEAAEAFDHAVDAVDLLVRKQLTRPAAEIWLARATEVAAEAAHAHAATGAPARAVLRLERGRARLLSAALRTTDTDLRRLRGTDADLAGRFRRAAARLHGLEHAALPRDPEHGGPPPALSTAAPRPLPLSGLRTEAVVTPVRSAWSRVRRTEVWRGRVTMETTPSAISSTAGASVRAKNPSTYTTLPARKSRVPWQPGRAPAVSAPRWCQRLTRLRTARTARPSRMGSVRREAISM
ncbi:hypothetical protein QA802_40440 [Streptomyces sp. B21-105]|uniref:hypothetical protein n=1 Tax=Streptomyces sp. B21-105 TaxID=3039417 RepID=UPI002FF2B54A